MSLLWIKHHNGKQTTLQAVHAKNPNSFQNFYQVHGPECTQTIELF